MMSVRVSRLTEPAREVDYRFILANERTFLAWMRTSLGLISGAGILTLIGIGVPVTLLATSLQ